MIISSEIEKVEKVENLIKAAGRYQKSILRAFARTQAKKCLKYNLWSKNGYFGYSV